MTALYEHKTELVGDDYTGLPTRPLRYRGAPKPVGIDWDKVTADYIAAGGQVDASVWPRHGKVVVIGGSANSSKANIHTFTEATEYGEAQAPKRTPRRRSSTPKPGYRPPEKLTVEQRITVGRRYTNGESLSELSRDYSVAVNTIVKTLKVLKVPTRSPAEAGRLRRQQGKS
jgi:hypothetical protein